MAWEFVREFFVGLSENKINKIRYIGFGSQLNFTFIETLDRDYERNSETILTNVNFNEYRYKVTIRNYNSYEFVYQYDAMPSGTIQISPALSRTIKIIVERELKNEAPTTTTFTSPIETVLKSNSKVNVEWNPSSDPEGDAISYALEVSIDNNNYQLLRDFSPSTGFSYNVPESSTVRFRVKAKDSRGAESGYAYSDIYNVVINKAPTLTLSTVNDKTLYEENDLEIKGQAVEQDSGNVISVKYRINNEPIKTIDAKVSDGITPLSFTKNLTFKQGKLYDGQTAVTGVLSEGVAHKLTVWSEDDQGGKSADVTRTFYVVPNRPATLTINSIANQSNLINSEKVTISGSVNDPENRDVTVQYKINGGNFVQAYNGPNGDFSFEIQISQLLDGDNTIQVQAIDSYGLVTTKSIKLNKTANLTPLRKSVARYKITPPTGSAQGVLLWIQREEGDLDVKAEISMTANGEQENFVPMILNNSAPVSEGITEDEWTYQATGAKENIVLKLTLERADVNSTESIKLLTGVLQ